MTQIKGDNLEKQIVIYDSPFTQIKSVEQARAEVAFLHKAFSLGMFNKIAYQNKQGGFIKGISSDSDKDITWVIDQIVSDAQKGKLPSRYSLGMNALYDGEKINTNISDIIKK